MTARIYEVTLISEAVRTVLTVIAHRSSRAVQIAIGMMPEATGQFAIICKPLCSLIDERSETCAAC